MEFNQTHVEVRQMLEASQLPALPSNRSIQERVDTTDTYRGDDGLSSADNGAAA